MSYDLNGVTKTALLTGMVLGGMVSGKYTTGNNNGKLYGAINAVAIFVLRGIARMCFGKEFLNCPAHLQIACITPMATLITGATANYFGFSVDVMTVTKIAAAAIVGGIGTCMIGVGVGSGMIDYLIT
jgi:hypothetical protein